MCVIGTAFATLTATKSYTARAALFFSVRTAESPDQLQQGATFMQAQMASYGRLATTPAVLQAVADTLHVPGGASALADQISVTAATGTVVLDLQVVDPDPSMAARIANATSSELVRVAENLSPADPKEARPGVLVTVIEPATVPHAASSPKTTQDLLGGVLLGLALGLLAAFGREALDTRIRSAADVAPLTDRPVLGQLPVDSGRHDAVVAEAPYSPYAESFRQLRTSLQFLDVGARAGGSSEAHRLLCVTSSVAGEGKTTVAVNLALALAETSARVLLVDADLRRPSVATRLGVEGAVGLTTVLLGQAQLSDVVQPWGSTGLDVLTSGALPPNPGELLGSPAMRSLLARFRAEYDFVVIDTAPLLPVADGAIVAGLVDGTLLLANVAKVRRHQLAEGLGNLARGESSLLGVVLNRVARDLRSYRYASDESGAETAGPDSGSEDKAGRITRSRPPVPAVR